ncbi:telomerase reverse transcriptase, partial [Lecanoromycetidae sp. Uapishka_2]
MSNLKLSMFEEINTVKARNVLDARTLGFSQIRLLPKGNSVRPITNLRRRVTKLQNGKLTLGRSINSIMAPVFNVLDYEKRKRPMLVGSALFSVGDMYPKLKSFALRLQTRQNAAQKLYFAKADARSCFDTIPQRKIVRLIGEIASEDDYRIARHAEIKAPDAHGGSTNVIGKPARKFITAAKASTDFTSLSEMLDAQLAKERKNTVFVDSVVQNSHKKRKMLDLLKDHVERNMIRIGKKFFRQKAGIPQGSVLSSLLCNYFYAQLEDECLSFLDDGESILLRLIDDFLLISTNKEHAKRFLHTMHNGIPDYGVEVNPAKSLANFEVTVNGYRVACLQQGVGFPYCGNSIDTRTLEITKDRDRRKGTADTLTVEPSKVPGKTFYRKALNAFKIQTHKMFLDTNFNSANTVLSTIYQNFAEAAMKYYRYAKCMQSAKQPHLDLLKRTIGDLVDLAFVLVKGRHRLQIAHDYDCAVSKRQVAWLAAKAFRGVLTKKQCRYGEVIVWLDDAIRESTARNRKEASRLYGIANKGDAIFSDYRY